MSRNKPGSPRRLSHANQDVMNQLVIGSTLEQVAAVLKMKKAEVRSRVRNLHAIFKARSLPQLIENYKKNRGML